ncbi:MULTISPECIES: TolC family protein [unclassified Beijerinckia]|uniref:TolC family protein n=1 Tax=unclassified Beijerinckia TaxID=2638183 RepID=UPI00089A25A0|nr:MULTISPECIES: TolC family protein [unclassified Beijerinckia]MDH7794477.1 outer membrane protein TolC [Beijerinckia sp. GAS462]SEB63640.1 Outer membrane protein TolC [Beijerinckia sp. 28-YEA-48]
MAPSLSRTSFSQRSRLLAVGLSALTLGGCASFTPDGGMEAVATQVSATLGADAVKINSQCEAASAAARVKALLAKPLTSTSAVQIALLNNRGLQAEYNTLGLSEADFVEASLPPNPTLALGRTVTNGGLDIERRIIANLLSLLTQPTRREIGERQFEAARYRAIDATFRTAANARKAYYAAVSARQKVTYLEQARTSADAAADLMRSLGETGAAKKLDQARTAAFYAEVSNQLAAARLETSTTREALTRSLGVWGSDINYKLPSQLPNLPRGLPSTQQVETQAIRQRVDLIASRLELDALATSLRLYEATRYVSAFELAGFSKFERSKSDGVVEKKRSAGNALDLVIEIPIFDFGETTRRRAAETYMQAVNRFAEQAVNIRSEARAAYLTHRGSYEIALAYRNKIVPLRRTVNEQSLLEYNGMLIDVFVLLTTFREGIDSNLAAISAQRDFFVAGVDFDTAIQGGGSGAGAGVRVASGSGE